MLAEIRLYTPATKQRIHHILCELLCKRGLRHHAEQFLFCLDELVKNGLKANYKFCLIRYNIENVLSIKGYEDRLPKILGDRIVFNKYAERYGEGVEAAQMVRRALTQEARLISIRADSRRERRRFNVRERAVLSEARDLIFVRNLVKRYNAKLHLRLDVFHDSLEIEIINTAPILETDLLRIRQKRAAFNRLADIGEKHVFFTEYLDDSDSGAGLGYATIDAALRDMNLDPLSVLSIISTTNTTIMFSVDLNLLRSHESEIALSVQSHAHKTFSPLVTGV